VPEELDQDLIGTVGQVTVPIEPTRPGEVMLPVRGGTEAFKACSDEPIGKYARVVVIELLTGRTVAVTRIT
jgi:membrane-bound ClpP family serine protease